MVIVLFFRISYWIYNFHNDLYVLLFLKELLRLVITWAYSIFLWWPSSWDRNQEVFKKMLSGSEAPKDGHDEVLIKIAID